MIVIKLNLQIIKIEMIPQDNTSSNKTCNCRNSKCVKLYCQCFANKHYCNKNCHCFECLNHDKNQLLNIYKYSTAQKKNPLFKSNQQLIKTHKGCACKKSGCMKKYCQCFQAGIVCSENCKCVECQNTDSSTNRKIVRQLKKNDTQQNPNALYTILLSQNDEHFNSIIQQNLDKQGSVDFNRVKKYAEVFYSILNENTEQQVIQSAQENSNIEIQKQQIKNLEQQEPKLKNLECNNEALEQKIKEEKTTVSTKSKLINAFIQMLKEIETSKMKIQIEI